MDDEQRIRWACRRLADAEARGLTAAQAWAGCKVGWPPSRLLDELVARGLVTVVWVDRPAPSTTRCPTCRPRVHGTHRSGAGLDRRGMMNVSRLWWPDP